ACWSPDGRRALTTCRDGTGRVWDVPTAKPLTPPLSLGPPTAACAAQVTEKGLAVFAHWRLNRHDTAIPEVPPAVFRLDDVAAAGPLGPDDWLLFGEVVSGKSVSGGGLVNLTGEEWLGRWRRWRAAHPELPGLPPPAEGGVTPGETERPLTPREASER